MNINHQLCIKLKFPNTVVIRYYNWNNVNVVHLKVSFEQFILEEIILIPMNESIKQIFTFSKKFHQIRLGRY